MENNEWAKHFRNRFLLHKKGNIKRNYVQKYSLEPQN